MAGPVPVLGDFFATILLFSEFFHPIFYFVIRCVEVQWRLSESNVVVTLVTENL